MILEAQSLALAHYHGNHATLECFFQQTVIHSLQLLKVGNVNVRPPNTAFMPIHSPACLSLEVATTLRHELWQRTEIRTQFKCLSRCNQSCSRMCASSRLGWQADRAVPARCYTKWIVGKTCGISANLQFHFKKCESVTCIKTDNAMPNAHCKSANATQCHRGSILASHVSRHLSTFSRWNGSNLLRNTLHLKISVALRCIL